MEDGWVDGWMEHAWMGRWREAVVVFFEFLHNGYYCKDFSGAAGCEWQDLGAELSKRGLGSTPELQLRQLSLPLQSIMGFLLRPWPYSVKNILSLA